MIDYWLLITACAPDILTMNMTHTGELGYVFYIPNEFALHVYDSILEAGKGGTAWNWSFFIRDLPSFFFSRAPSQCSGYLTFWYGFGSPDPHHWIRVPDPDPALFFSGLQHPIKKKLFPVLTVGTGSFTPVFKDNKLFRSQKLWKSRFFCKICLLTDGSIPWDLKT